MCFASSVFLPAKLSPHAPPIRYKDCPVRWRGNSPQGSEVDNARKDRFTGGARTELTSNGSADASNAPRDGARKPSYPGRGNGRRPDQLSTEDRSSRGPGVNGPRG